MPPRPSGSSTRYDPSVLPVRSRSVVACSPPEIDRTLRRSRGYAATTDVKNISLAVWDQSRTAQSRALLDAYRAANYFRITYSVGSADEYRRF